MSINPGLPIIEHAPLSSDETLEFTWLPPSDTGSGPITDYRLILDNGGPTTIYDVSIYYAKITGLTNGLLYTATIEASNDDGVTWGPAATFRPFEPQAGGPPAAPTNIIISGFNSTSSSNINISWTPSVSGNPNWYVLKSYSYIDNDLHTDPNQVRVTANGLTQTNYFTSLPSNYASTLNLGLSIPFLAAAVNYAGYSDYVNSSNYVQNGFRNIDTENVNGQMLLDPGISFGTQSFTIEFWTQAFNDSTLNFFQGTGIYLQITLTNPYIDIQSSDGSFSTRFTLRNMVAYERYAIKHYIVCRNNSNQLAVWVNGVRTGVPQTCTTNFSGINTRFPSAGVNALLANLRIVVGSAVYDTTQTTLQVLETSYLTLVTGTQLLLLDQLSGTDPQDVTGTQTITFPGTVPPWNPFRRIFNPTIIPGCIIWLDGFDSTTLLTTGGTPCILETELLISVTTWKDKSGTGNDFVVPNGIIQPYLNYANNGVIVSNFTVNPSTVYFFKQNFNYMQSTNPAVYPVDCFIVLQNNSASGNVFGIAAPDGTNYNALQYSRTGNGFGTAQNNSTDGLRTPGTSGNADGVILILEWSIQNGQFTIRNFSDPTLAPSYIVSQTSYSWTMTPGSFFVLGANNLGTSTDQNDYFTSDIAEVIAFNSSISGANRLAVAKYLGYKYGVNV